MTSKALVSIAGAFLFPVNLQGVRFHIKVSRSSSVRLTSFQYGTILSIPIGFHHRIAGNSTD